MERALKILKDTREIARQEKFCSAGQCDLSLYEDLLVSMAHAYTHIPPLRIQWLQRLADHLNTSGKYAEAAQATLQVADLVMQQYRESLKAEQQESPKVCISASAVSVFALNADLQIVESPLLEVRNPVLMSLDLPDCDRPSSKTRSIDLRTVRSDIGNCLLCWRNAKACCG